MKTHFEKKDFDIEWLLEHSNRHFTCSQIDRFVERVGIKQDSNIPESEARFQAYEEMFR